MNPMTDEQLAEWSATKVMGWHKDHVWIEWYDKCEQSTGYTMEQECSDKYVYWNPCAIENLYQVWLLEERIEKIDATDQYIYFLGQVIYREKGEVETTFTLLHATARQKVEAMYMVLEGEK